jgi:hypothetical protein
MLLMYRVSHVPNLCVEPSTSQGEAKTGQTTPKQRLPRRLACAYREKNEAKLPLNCITLLANLSEELDRQHTANPIHITGYWFKARGAAYFLKKRWHWP